MRAVQLHVRMASAIAEALGASAEAAGVSAELAAAQAHQLESRSSNFPITISFRSGQTAARVEQKDGMEKMVRKSEVHAHHMAAAGALFARASQAKAPKEDPEAAPPPELLAGSPASLSGNKSEKTTGQDASQEEPSSPAKKASTAVPPEDDTNAAAGTAPQATAEQEDVPMEEDMPEDTKPQELPASFPFPKGYPPPREEGLPANFPFPQGYPPPPDQPGSLPANFLYPKGYPPPPETDEPKTAQLTPPGAPVVPGIPGALPPPPAGDAPPLLLPPYGAYPTLPPGDPSAALLAAPPPPPGVPGAPPGLPGGLPALSLMTPPPPPPGDPSTAPLVVPQVDPTTGRLLPPPPGVPASSSGVPPPPPMGGEQQAFTSDTLAAFIVENKIDSRAAGALRALPLDIQQKVVSEGLVTGTNPSAVLTARIRKFELQAGRTVGTAPGVEDTAPGSLPPPPPNAMLPPGAIGPQPAGVVDAAAPKADLPPPPSLLPPGLTTSQLLALGMLQPGAAAAAGLPGGLHAHLLAGTLPGVNLAGQLSALGPPPLPPGLTAPGALQIGAALPPGPPPAP